MSALKTAMCKALVPATDTMAKKVMEKIDDKIMEYYEGYSPVYYERTGAMIDVPQKTDATGGDNTANAEVYADLSHQYLTGNWNMPEVWDSANNYLHGGLNVGNGVAVWDEPMNEVESESRAMWKDALNSAGLNVK